MSASENHGNLRSNRFFSVEKYGSTLSASHAASDYGKQFTGRDNGYRSFDAPRLWVKFDHDKQGYYIEPNLDFLPRLNFAWQGLVELETEGSAPVTPRQGT